MKEEPILKSVITMDIVVEKSVPLGQEGSGDAKNEAPPVATSDDAGSEGEDESISDGSSCDSSSSSNKSSIYSISET